ncbi:4246_t:CDS:2 [Paraglomus brasilianum]|uniref:4246_t:CDS:1 n=1 Tax=Paraglomus brasilianum TaxID=144538 RepID=A0A9N9APG0_9GLOM|nr:4246_t:CDS:2 [Paraglomus brasilianum]
MLRRNPTRIHLRPEDVESVEKLRELYQQKKTLAKGKRKGTEIDREIMSLSNQDSSVNEQSLSNNDFTKSSMPFDYMMATRAQRAKWINDDTSGEFSLKVCWAAVTFFRHDDCKFTCALIRAITMGKLQEANPEYDVMSKYVDTSQSSKHFR